MVVYEKIYFKAYTNDEYISDRNKIVQLYFILGTAELRWIFSSILKDDFDIYRFSNRKWVSTMYNVGTHRIYLSSCRVLCEQIISQEVLICTPQILMWETEHLSLHEESPWRRWKKPPQDRITQFLCLPIVAFRYIEDTYFIYCFTTGCIQMGQLPWLPKANWVRFQESIPKVKILQNSLLVLHHCTSHSQCTDQGARHKSMPKSMLKGDGCTSWPINSIASY